MKYLKLFEAYQKEYSIDDIYNQKVYDRNYINIIFDYLRMKKKLLGKSKSKILRLVSSDKQVAAKPLADELYSKIPTNIKSYNQYVIPKINKCFSEIKYDHSSEEDIKKVERLKDVIDSINYKVSNNKMRMSDITDPLFLKFIQAFKYHIFDFETIENIMKKLYDINKFSKRAENTVKQYYSEKYPKFKAVDAPKKLDMKQGVDIQLINKETGSVRANIQVKMANKVKINKGDVYDMVIVDTKGLDLNLLKRKKMWDALVIIHRGDIYTIARKDIRSKNGELSVYPKKYGSKGFVITVKKGSVLKDEIKLSEESIKDIEWWFKS